MKFKVIDNRLSDTNGEQIQLRGISSHQVLTEFGRFLNEQTINTLVKDWNINSFRIAVDINIYRDVHRTVIEGIDVCLKNGITPILDWHSFGNPNDNLDKAIEFFSKYTKIYGDSVIYEICNEPTDCEWKDVKEYANKIIPVIRDIVPDSLIIVGTPHWSQRIEDPFNDPLNFDNILYTLHIYSSSHDHLFPVFDEFVDRVPLICTEFGACNATGDGNFDPIKGKEWIDRFNKHQISWFAWSLSDKRETSSILKPGSTSYGNWSDNRLTESGLYIKECLK